MSLIPNEYRLIVKDGTGNVLIPHLQRYSFFEYSRTVNNVGACRLVMAYEDKASAVETWQNFKVDGRLEVWRSVNGAAQYLDNLYFLRKFARDKNADGLWTMTFTGKDTISLLERRTTSVNPKAATVNITVAKAADDCIKDLFENYLGDDAGAGFDVSAYISQQVDFTAAQTITKQFPGRTVLQVMQEMAQASTTNGTYLAFDVVTDGSSFEFRTYTGQRGTDRRASTGNYLLIGTDVGNVLSCHYEDDHENEATYIVNGSQNASDATREGVSPFGRIMKVIATSPNGAAAQLLKDAEAQLRLSRPKKLFSAEMIQTLGCLFGVHYNYGDYVTVSDFGEQFDCHLDAQVITIQDGAERVGCVLRGES